MHIILMKMVIMKCIGLDEDYCEYIHTEQDIELALKNAGFTILEKRGHLGKKLTPISERINYIVKKIVR